MPVHANSDDGFVDDPFTLISRLDMSDPLHLHPNDFTALTVVSTKVKGTKNYQVWSCVMLLDLEGKNKTSFIDRSCRRSNTDEVLGRQWDRFLMGLDDSYMQIRSSILSREVLLDVKSAYAIISSEESHIVSFGSINGSSWRNQAFDFVFNVPNKGSFQRNQASDFVSNVNNNRQNGGSGLVCKNYGFNGYTIDRCFKITGYPANFGKKKPGQNVTEKNISNNNSVGSSSSSGFTNEQMATLISLIKDNKVRKNVQANMGVGHPNGIEAFIYKNGNLILPNGLVLFDVLVVPQYCVTLISVHKFAKDNKICVAFDESRCYFLNQDLNLKNILGIGN
ncbi:ribonuclease H-like domain-containing protein [Tanacetum coccineum]